MRSMVEGRVPNLAAPARPSTTGSAGGPPPQALLGEDEHRAALLPLPLAGEGRGEGTSYSDSPHPLSQPSPQRGEGYALTLADPLEIDLAPFDAIIVSPGVPLNRHPIAAHARAANVALIGDIELFAQARATLPPHKVVGITGTNGKSTTTALVRHICETAGLPTLMGGNIGLPILSRDPLPEGGVYVLELSSYQIDLTDTLDCDVAVLLNVTPDHLDRYESFGAYLNSKVRLLEMQSQDTHAIVASKEPQVNLVVNALTVGAEWTWWFHGSYETDFVQEQKRWPSLQGPHNAQNAWAARMVCLKLGLSADVVNEGLRTYPGLPHRMERVTEREGVLYVNDSKATNAASTAPALGAYPRIHWILGGKAKTDELDACAPYYGHVVAGYTIGEAGPLFANILRAAGKPVTESGTLDQAVRDAAAAAQAGEVVMLSPACASFDQFRDFEDRGDAFRKAVGGLA